MAEVDDRAIMELADELASLKGRMDLLEDGSLASQLKYSSIENGAIAVFDREGLERLRLGLQPDGTFTSSSKNNPDPPPVPRVPLLTAGKGTVKIQSQGSVREDASWPADFSHLNVWASINQGPNQRVGTISTDPGMFVLGPLDYVPIEIWFTAVNHSGKESVASESATTTPEKVVGSDLLAGTITALQIAAEAVERAKIAVGAIGPVQLDDDAVRNQHVQAGAITGEQIRANTITALNIAARTITGELIVAETILGEHIVGRTIDAEKLTALSITANEIAANAITAGKVAAGTVTADKLEAILLLATEIIAGNPLGARVAFNLSGINAFNMAGERTFQLDAQTGDVRVSGIVESGIDGSIVRITPGEPDHPLQTPGVYIYADGANFPALIYATPAGSALGVRPSALQIIASLDDTGAAGHLSLRDEGAQLQYARMFTTGTLNELKPVGGYVSAIADAAAMRVQDVGGLGQTDGGFIGATRTDAQFGLFKDGGATGGLLVWAETGRLALYGKLQANHGDSGFGWFLTNASIPTAGPTTVTFTYGSTDTDWDTAFGRLILHSWESSAANYLWVSANNSTGCSIRLATAAIGWINLASIGIGA